MDEFRDMSGSREAVLPAAVQAQLARILASEGFGKAPRLARFLDFAVKQALAGRGERLKEYVLGVEVFDRGEGFDPRTDPIVRVDARRLRERLEAYYAGEGAGDPVEIAFAKGGYAPVFRLRTRADASGPGAPVRLAVLPFGDETGEAGFAVGLTDDLLIALGRRPDLRVSGAASAFRFDETQDLQEIGRRLGAEVVMTGEVRRKKDRLRVSVRLSAVDNATQIWSQRYDAALDGAAPVFALRDRIAEEIGSRLAPRARAGRSAHSRAPTFDMEAYELFLRGRRLLQAVGPATLGQAIGFLEQAAARDPGFADAWTALADAHFSRAVFLTAPPIEAMRASAAMAERALTIDPAQALALARLGSLSAAMDHDFPAAQARFAAALDLEPMSSAVRQQRAMWLLAPLGRLDEAAAELGALLEDDPYSALLRFDYARVLMFQRRYGESIRHLELLLDLEPRFPGTAFCLAFAYERQGSDNKVRMAHERHVRELPYPLVEAWFEAATAVWDGRMEQARKLVLDMEPAAMRLPIAATVMADACLRIGDRRRAVTWLGRAIDERVFRCIYLKVDPDYDALRGEAGFEALVARLGLTPG
jgi:serine/threonine-protein kinase